MKQKFALKSKPTRNALLGLGFIAVLIVLFLMDFSFQLNRTLRRGTERQMSASTAQITYFVNSRLEDIFSTMGAISFYVGEQEDMTSPRVMEKLRQMVEEHQFYALTVVFPGESAYMHDGRVYPSVEYRYYQKVMEGETAVSAVNNSKLDGVDIVSFSVPIRQSGKVAAALSAANTPILQKHLFWGGCHE